MDRRPWLKWTNRQLPRRFRDELPVPLPSLPPTALAQSMVQPEAHLLSSTTAQQVAPMASDASSHGTPPSHLRQFYTTPQNIFGLSRRYYAEELPSHDPEDYTTLNDLCNISLPAQSPVPQSFYPYPNRNAFLLGEWFWNGGNQKSQRSFKDLLDIVGDSEFHPMDVREAKWNEINNKLANGDEKERLIDQEAGWTRKSIKLMVPFQRRRGEPSDPQSGLGNFEVHDFYHRNLTTAIREKISNPCHHQHFHYEPYELNWYTGCSQRPVRVFGELYTSPAFIESHRQLQDSPPEPNCDLPRVVVALMFWSDATHLTSFGDAKLHPLYMFYGNESKYRRCKPSCGVCEHVAYFQPVSIFFSFLVVC